jgi:hypothetical protein
MGAVAELEAGMISGRTKSALAAAKARGKKLDGNRGVKVTRLRPQVAIGSSNAQTNGPPISLRRSRTYRRPASGRCGALLRRSTNVVFLRRADAANGRQCRSAGLWPGAISRRPSERQSDERVDHGVEGCGCSREMARPPAAQGRGPGAIYQSSPGGRNSGRGSDRGQGPQPGRCRLASRCHRGLRGTARTNREVFRKR